METTSEKILDIFGPNITGTQARQLARLMDDIADKKAREHTSRLEERWKRELERKVDKWRHELDISSLKHRMDLLAPKALIVLTIIVGYALILYIIFHR